MPVLSFRNASAAMLAAGFSICATSLETKAGGYVDADQVNRIINQLDPAGCAYRAAPYKRQKYSRYGNYAAGAYQAGQGHGDYRGVDLALYFETGSSRISRRGARALDDLAYALKSRRLRGAVYEIAGHTDARGDSYSNRYLSEQRARAVKDYLVHEHGVHPRRLRAIGLGEEYLLDRAYPYARVNRRVEIRLIARDYDQAAGYDAEERNR